MGVSKTNKTYASRYKTDVSVSQTSNVGFDTTTRKICSGDGADSAISLSDDVLSIQPVNDDSVGTLLCKTSGGSNILAVDTTNSKVLLGASQVAANTQYVHFGIDSTEGGAFVANTHYMIPFSANGIASGGDHAIGTGTDPDLSLTISTSADGVVNAMWYVLDNITIDAVIWWSGSTVSTGEVTRAHLVSYTVDTDNGTTGGDLSSGVIIADGADITNAGNEQAYYQSLTIQSADVDAGKAVFFIYRQDGTDNTGINATVKYHIR